MCGMPLSCVQHDSMMRVQLHPLSGRHGLTLTPTVAGLYRSCPPPSKNTRPPPTMFTHRNTSLGIEIHPRTRTYTHTQAHTHTYTHTHTQSQYISACICGGGSWHKAGVPERYIWILHWFMCLHACIICIHVKMIVLMVWSR